MHEKFIRAVKLDGAVTELLLFDGDIWLVGREKNGYASLLPKVVEHIIKPLTDQIYSHVVDTYESSYQLKFIFRVFFHSFILCVREQ